MRDAWILRILRDLLLGDCGLAIRVLSLLPGRRLTSVAHNCRNLLRLLKKDDASLIRLRRGRNHHGRFLDRLISPLQCHCVGPASRRSSNTRNRILSAITDASRGLGCRGASCKSDSPDRPMFELSGCGPAAVGLLCRIAPEHRVYDLFLTTVEIALLRGCRGASKSQLACDLSEL